MRLLSAGAPGRILGLPVLAAFLAIGAIPRAVADPLVTVHVAPRPGTNCSSVSSLPCSDYDTAGDVLTGYDVYIVGAGVPYLDGIAGIELGLEYDAGIGTFGTTRCADLEFPSPGWPASGTGNVLVFSPETSCQQNSSPGNGVQAVFFSVYVYAYSEADLRVVPRPATGQIALSDCSSAELPVGASARGLARFSPGASRGGVNPCLGDIYPPGLVSASGVDGGNTIEVVFDEPVPNGASPSFYEVFETGAGSPLSVLAASLVTSSSVVLEVGTPLDGGVSYTVRVTGVEDAAGNPIVPGSTVEFAPPVDAVAPSLVSASGNAGFIFVDVTFSEPVLQAENTTDYEVFETGSGTPLPVGDAALLGASVVRLALTTPLAPATDYTVRVNGVTDLAGNPIAPNSTTGFTTPVPPTLVAANGASGDSHVFVTFSEAVTGAGFSSHYELFETAGGTSIAVTSASQTGADEARLTLASPLLAGTSYTVRVNDVLDLDGNPIPPNSTIEFSTAPDTDPPTLVAATGTYGSSTVLVTFSEPIPDGADPSHYEVYETGSGIDLPVVSATPTTATSFQLGLASTLRSGTAYTVRVNGVSDAAGNPIAVDSEAGFTTSTDSSIPSVVLVQGAEGAHYVVVIFSEAIDPATGGDTSNYALTAQAGSPAYTVTGITVQTNRAVVSVDRGLVAGPHVLSIRDVEDLGGNPVPPGIHEFHVTPAVPTALQNPVIATHLGPEISKGDPCATTLPACEDFEVRGSTRTVYTLYLVLVDPESFGSGFAGVELGLEYGPELIVIGWQRCSDLEFPTSDWPYSGSGNVMTWSPSTNCQNEAGPDGVRTIAGALSVYAYSDARFQVVERPATGQMAVSDCFSAERPLRDGEAGVIGIGSWLGYNPCTAGGTPTPVKETTWGALKKLYATDDESR